MNQFSINRSPALHPSTITQVSRSSVVGGWSLLVEALHAIFHRHSWRNWSARARGLPIDKSVAVRWHSIARWQSLPSQTDGWMRGQQPAAAALLNRTKLLLRVVGNGIFAIPLDSDDAMTTTGGRFGVKTLTWLDVCSWVQPPAA